MINTVSSFYMLGVAEAGMLLQFPFLVREKGALIDRQSLSCISLPQVATGPVSYTHLDVYKRQEQLYLHSHNEWSYGADDPSHGQGYQ